MKTNRLLLKSVVNSYASVLFEASCAEDHALSNVKELEQTAALLRSQRELAEALDGSELPAANKEALVHELFDGNIAPELVSSIVVMAQRSELSLLDRVAESYRELVEDKLNVVIAEVTTAVALDDQLRGLVTNKLKDMTGKDAYLEETVDPSIIGGIIVNAQGKRIDASVSAQLMHARSVLSKTVSIGGEA